jgi:hypothetical protein
MARALNHLAPCENATRAEAQRGFDFAPQQTEQLTLVFGEAAQSV